eukprot:403362749
MKDTEAIDKIFRICSKDLSRFHKEVQENKRRNFDLYRIVFTADNFLKINLIYLRIRARQVVTIMGETGVGKTVLIEYLKDVLNWQYAKLNVHEGVTEEKIIEFVEKANLVASGRVQSYSELQNKTQIEIQNLIQNDIPQSKKPEPQNVILFFDEVNTNYNISGLIKEILMDRRCMGKKISDTICLISACNPYKKIVSNINQNDRYTTGLQHQLQLDQWNNLVYRVYLLTKSQLTTIWNFGQLSEQEQKIYIKKIINDVSKHQTDFDEQIENYIVEAVHKSQEYIKSVETAWSVSLRDVDRFRRLFIFFLENNCTNGKQDKDLLLKRVLVLTLSVCYKFRLSKNSLRSEYEEQIIQIGGNQKYCILKREDFSKYLTEECDSYIDEMEIPIGIGKNDSLKENVFSIIIMILNKIPLFIAGKPGSSKTLAMNLVLKTMKGQGSSKDFYKKLPSVMPFFYQGSIQSTSMGIDKVFDRAFKANEALQKRYEEEFKDQIQQNAKNNPNVIVVVIIDEIGLAEISPHNPLKVLHAYLEMPDLGFVGISNYNLDASKQNRVITLQKPEPRNDDLIQAAVSQSRDINGENDEKHLQFKEYYVHRLVRFYLHYYQEQRVQNFHGLRDFYQMICQICFQLKTSDESLMTLIINSVARNFGGNNLENVMEYLYNEFKVEGPQKIFQAKESQVLIKENIQDNRARNLMIISEHLEIINVRFIEQVCQQLGRPYKIFYGSDFEKDKQEQSIHRTIQDIIGCMETGTICILMNLDNIYQAFYDMLNQNYQEINKQKYCKVAIGPDSTKCIVHPDFRCIILTNSSKVSLMDPPLLNRFEKQIYNINESITSEQLQLIERIEQWMKEIGGLENKFSYEQMFSVLCYNNKQLRMSLISLVLMVKNLGIEEDSYEYFCKEQLIGFANQLSMLRCPQSIATDRCEWFDIYQNEQKHNDVKQALYYYQGIWKTDEILKQSESGLNLVFYTFSANTKDLFITQDKSIDDTPIILASITSKDELENLLQKHFDQFYGEKTTKFIIADQHKDSLLTIQLCKSLINQIRIKYILEFQEQKDNKTEIVQKNLVLIVKIKENFNSNIYFTQGWKELFIDLTNGKGNSSISQEFLLNSEIKEIFENKGIFKELLEHLIKEIMSKFKYNRCNTLRYEERVNQISSLITGNQLVYSTLLSLFISQLQASENFDEINRSWQYYIASNKQDINSIQSFHGAALNYFRILILKYYTYMIYELEQNNLIDYLVNGEQNMQLHLLSKFKKLFESKGFQNIAYKLGNSYLVSETLSVKQFPFFNKIYSIIKNAEPIIKEQISNTVKQEQISIMKVEYFQDKLQSYQDKLEAFQNGKYKTEEFTDEEDNEDQIDAIQLQTETSTELNKNEVQEILEEIKIEDDEEQYQQAKKKTQKLTLNQMKNKIQQLQELIEETKLQIQLSYQITKTDLDEKLANCQEYLSHYLDYQEIDKQLFWENLCSKVTNDNQEKEWTNLISQIIFTRDPQIQSPLNQYLILASHQDILAEIIKMLKSFQSFVNIDKIFELMNEHIQNYNNQCNNDMQGIDFYPQYVIYDSFIKSFTKCIQPSEELFIRLRSSKELQYEDLVSQIVQSLMYLNPFRRSDEIQKIQFYSRYKQRIIKTKSPNELIELAESVQNITDPILIIGKLNGIEVEEDEGEDNEIENPEEDRNYDEELKLSEIRQDSEEEIKSGSIDEDDKDYLMCCFILQYLADEFQKVRKTKQERFMKFVINTLKLYKREIKREPLIAQELLKQMCNMMIEQYGGIQLFTSEITLNYERTIANPQNSIIKLLTTLIDEDSKLSNVESPIIVLLCDLIEQQIEEQNSWTLKSKVIDEELMQIHFDTSLNSQIPIIKRISALANVRQILKQVSTQITDAYQNQSPAYYEKYLEIVDQYFSREQFERVKPLIIYLLKNVNEKIDFNIIIKELESENKSDNRKYQWVKNFTSVGEDLVMYNILLDVKMVMRIQDTLKQGLNQRFQEKYVQKWENKPVLKYQVGLAIYQHHFLNKELDLINLSSYMEHFTRNTELDQSILKRIIQRDYSVNQYQYLYDNKSLQERELLSYTMNACLQSDSQCYFAQLFRNPVDVANIYMPFNLNHQDDIAYYTFRQMFDIADTSLLVYKAFTKYQCKNQNCKAPFFVTECGNIQGAMEYRRDRQLGGGKCEECGAGIGYGFHTPQDQIYKKSILHDFEEESQKSYIYATFDEYSNLPYPIYKLRDLGIINLYIGQLIQRLIILSSFLMQDEQMQYNIIKIYGNPQVKDDLVNHFITDQFNNLRKFASSLEKQLQINEQKLTILIETILQRMFLQSGKNGLFKEQLITIQGRRAFEKYFEENVIIYKDTEKIHEFLRTTQPAILEFQHQTKRELQQLIEENIDIDDMSKMTKQHQMPSLLRLQGKPTYDNFKLHLQDDQNNECKFIKTIISKKDMILNISHLKIFLDWIHFVFDHFNAKISFEESQKLKVENALRKLNEDEYQQGTIIFLNFKESWNFLCDRLEMVDGCDRIQFAQINEDTTFSTCCITQDRKDTAGIYFYYLLARLGKLQNDLIEAASEIKGYEILKSQIEKPVQFMNLKDYQILNEIINVEFITQELKNYSQNKLVYGEGKNVQYDTKKLADTLFQKIFQNKAYIELYDESQSLEFIYENLTNPLNQYDEIQTKIKQIRQNQNYNITEQQGLGSSEKRINLLLDIQTAMNYLQDVGGEPTQYLTDFMKAFKITRNIDHIRQGIQLQHILDYYEQLEQSLETKLVDRCRPEFQEELSEQQKQEFRTLINKIPDKLEELKTIIGRLIIRQLCDSGPFSNEYFLVQYIFENADLNQYLFGIEQQVDVQSYLKVFGNCEITIAQAYHTHKFLMELLKEKQNELIKERQEKEKQERRNQEKASHQFVQDEEQKGTLKDIIGQSVDNHQTPSLFGDDMDDDYDDSKYLSELMESQKPASQKEARNHLSTKNASSLFKQMKKK